MTIRPIPPGWAVINGGKIIAEVRAALAGRGRVVGRIEVCEVEARDVLPGDLLRDATDFGSIKVESNAEAAGAQEITGYTSGLRGPLQTVYRLPDELVRVTRGFREGRQ